MIRFKRGVDSSNIDKMIWLAIGVAERIYSNVGVIVTITALRDGVHGKGSLHYDGKALDLRTRMLTSVQTADVLKRLRNALEPMGFDAIFESDHIHIEWQPKGDEQWMEEVD